MKKVNIIFIPIFIVFTIVSVLVGAPVLASPYGTGAYGANVPYGSETSITISAGNVNISTAPTSSGQLSTSSGVITVYSTDVVGYKLYVSALSSTSLTSGANTIPTTSNVTSLPLSVNNTWGYNTDASSNFIRMTTTSALLKNFVGPSRLGDATTVTYGVNLDFTQRPGSYSTTVLYTAVPQTT
jgi:hypothetical protein